MFGKIRGDLDRIATTLEAATARLASFSEGLQTPERLSALEGEMGRVLGEARGLIQEAEARFAAARASEERNRHQVKRLERLQEFADSDDEGLEELPWDVEDIQGGDVGRGQANGVPPVRSSMDPYGEEGERLAEQAKWGRLPPGTVIPVGDRFD